MPSGVNIGRLESLLDRSQNAVGAKLFEEESRTLWHGFERGVLPGLDAQLVRGSPFIAELFPDAVEANQIDGWKDQCGF
jgi:hypothetical protein